MFYLIYIFSCRRRPAPHSLNLLEQLSTRGLQHACNNSLLTNHSSWKLRETERARVSKYLLLLPEDTLPPLPYLSLSSQVILLLKKKWSNHYLVLTHFSKTGPPTGCFVVFITIIPSLSKVLSLTLFGIFLIQL